MIPQRDLSRISNGLYREGQRRVPEAVIERDYCLAWFLTALAKHSLREFLAFKGGTALRRCWFENYRFSEDLDFSLIQPIELDRILAGLDEIFAIVEAASGIRMEYDRPDRADHKNTHTFYLNYKGPLPARSDIKVDITIKEVFCFPLKPTPPKLNAPRTRRIRVCHRHNSTMTRSASSGTSPMVLAATRAPRMYKCALPEGAGPFQAQALLAKSCRAYGTPMNVNGPRGRQRRPNSVRRSARRLIALATPKRYFEDAGLGASTIQNYAVETCRHFVEGLIHCDVLQDSRKTWRSRSRSWQRHICRLDK